MKDNIKKANRRDKLINEAIDILTMKYGAKFTNSIYKLSRVDSNTLSLNLIRPGKISDFDTLMNSKEEYFVRIYVQNNKVNQITIIKIADIIDYVNKHNSGGEYINIDLNKFNYDITIVDPNNLGDTDCKVVDCDDTELYDSKQESNYTTGMTYINGLPKIVMINANTGNAVVF